MLLQKAFQLANNPSTISNFKFEEAMRALEAKEENMKGKAIMEDTDSRMTIMDREQQPTSCPPSTFKGGRPAHTALKTWIATAKKKRTKTSRDAEDKVTDWPDEEQPMFKKRRSLKEITNNCS